MFRFRKYCSNIVSLCKLSLWSQTFLQVLSLFNLWQILLKTKSIRQAPINSGRFHSGRFLSNLTGCPAKWKSALLAVYDFFSAQQSEQLIEQNTRTYSLIFLGNGWCTFWYINFKSRRKQNYFQKPSHNPIALFWCQK